MGRTHSAAYKSVNNIFGDEVVPELVVVADVNEENAKAVAEKYGYQRWTTDWHEIMDDPAIDLVDITTPNASHCPIAIQAAKHGKHVYCEKPLAMTAQEAAEATKAVEKAGVVTSVGFNYVWNPIQQYVKELIASGELGEPVTISQTENVGYWHQAHSFVRGNWRNSKESSCMILQKCCHDLDIIKWLMDMPCRTVSSFGSLMYFNKAHAPAGSADFCYKCKLEKECPYDAIGFYMDKPDWLSSTGRFFGNSANAEEVRACLSDESNPYARCVFKCDNDVVDHQVVNMLFEGGKTAQLTMTAFSKDFRRTIKVHLTGGEIMGDIAANRIDYTAWGRETVTIDVTKLADDLTHHCGGDKLLVRDFYDYICGNPSGKGLTAVGNSLESHLMAFAAEKSRLSGGEPVQIGK